jgi:hypothetical protein
MGNTDRDNILRSWKEIAAYLGYDQRTCYRWEQRFGMPVHRAEGGGSKSHVVAYKDELDAWFQATFTNSSRPAPPRPAPRLAARRLLLALVPAAAVAVFFILRSLMSSPGQPADFRIRGSSLVVLDESGRELWRRDTKVEGLIDDEAYRALFRSVDSTKTSVRLPSLDIRDIDGDGRNEVLLAIQKKDDAYGEGRLLCYDSQGKERWHFDAGREMRFGGRTYSPDYRIYGFALHDFNGDGKQEVVVISYHYPQWPCQVALLDAQGRLTGEFWNSGFLNDVAIQDIDADGKDELIVSGVNNEYGGCLIVFDAARISGSSPQTGEFRSDTLPPGTEDYYVRFPRSDVSLARGDPVEGLQHLGITGNKHITVYSDYGIIYELDFQMRCLGIEFGHGYMRQHDALRAQGRVHTSLDDTAYREAFRTGVRYWNGMQWAAATVPNARDARAGK